ncbi:hypothetical protein [Pseudosporangium ferrugineum]|uniref:Lipoprotein n=1 Tax=Pseudosporangium ferrugineum TaxID=439699 RepID=A0A2T0SFC6_9ACTN|nr:hypothetical protein [Pseudosporangium ferrugineum]PRY32118.1 hypothetical protein CLV70_102329 [Pseudosporangium ferrugineum]
MKKKLIALLALPLLGPAACTGEESTSEAQVATLASAGPVASAPADADAGRPRLRLDITDEEREALDAALISCVKANGVPEPRFLGWGDFRSMTKLAPGVLEKAKVACRSKMPLPAWEEDPDNPHAADFARAVATCLRAKGVKMVENPSDGSYSFDDGSASKGLELKPACEREAAAKGIGR